MAGFIVVLGLVLVIFVLGWDFCDWVGGYLTDDDDDDE